MCWWLTFYMVLVDFDTLFLFESFLYLLYNHVYLDAHQLIYYPITFLDHKSYILTQNNNGKAI